MISLRVLSTPSRLEAPRIRRGIAIQVMAAGPPATGTTRRPNYESMSIPELCQVILDADAPRRSRPSSA